VIGEPGRTVLFESGKPLVGDRSRDVMAAAELAHGKDAALDVANEPQSCVDHRHLLPRHNGLQTESRRR